MPKKLPSGWSASSKNSVLCTDGRFEIYTFREDGARCAPLDARCCAATLIDHVKERSVADFTSLGAAVAGSDVERRRS